MEKTKIVVVEGQEYQLGKMRAEEGAYIHWRMLGVLLAKASSQQQPEAGQQSEPSTVEAEPIDKAKMLCTSAFMMGLSFEDTQFAQRCALSVVGRVETVNGTQHVIPIRTAGGQFVPAEIGENPALLSQLTIEALAFNLEPFFSKSRSASL